MIIYTTINHPGIKENKLSSLLRWQCKYYLSNTTWSIHHLTQLKRNQSSAGAPVVKSSANQQQATDNHMTHLQHHRPPHSLKRVANTATFPNRPTNIILQQWIIDPTVYQIDYLHINTRLVAILSSLSFN